MYSSIEFRQREIRKGILNISKETIDRIPKVRLFNNSEKDNQLYNLHKNLLSIAMTKNRSKEVGILWNIYTGETRYIIGGKDFIDLKVNPEINYMINNSMAYSLVFMHNHPRNTHFSPEDLRSFCDYTSLVAMTAVCNDGRVHSMRKDSGFNGDAIKIFYNDCGKGMKGVFKSARKLNIVYKCSVPRRKEIIT